MNGKAVVIAGGSSGIGLAAALEFAREGANVLICGRDPKKLEAAGRLFQAEGLSAELLAEDISQKAGVTALAERAMERFGRLDVWMNNAGTGVSKGMMDYSDDELDRLLAVNFKSAYWGCVAAAERMKAQRGGVILNTASFAIKMPLSSGGIYAACKSAVHSLTKSFAAELGPYGIRVLSLVPGFIETPLTKAAVEQYRQALTMSISAGRLGLPEDLAKPIVFLSSDAAGYISGVPIEISGAKYTVQDPWTPWQALEK